MMILIRYNESIFHIIHFKRLLHSQWWSLPCFRLPSDSRALALLPPSLLCASPPSPHSFRFLQTSGLMFMHLSSDNLPCVSGRVYSFPDGVCRVLACVIHLWPHPQRCRLDFLETMEWVSIIFLARHCEGDHLLDAGGDFPVFRYLCDKHAWPCHLHDGHHIARGEKSRLSGNNKRKFCGENIEKRCEGKPRSERGSAQPVWEWWGQWSRSLPYI